MEWALVLATAAALLLLFAAAEWAVRRGVLTPDTSRRLVHVLGAGAAATFPLYLRLRDLMVLAAIFTLFLTGTWWRGRLRSVHGVDRATAGAILFPAGLALAALAVWPNSGALAFGALALAVCDPAAAVAGSRVRGPSWRVPGGSKSLAGSLAFFTIALALGLIFTFAHGTFRPAQAVLAAAILTTVEGALGYGLDNLLLPALAAVLSEALLGL